MARFNVTHSTDACSITIEGDKRKPEPSTAVIRFPGGCVEVSRTSDGHYWCHVSIHREESHDAADLGAGRIVDSRIDYVHGAQVHYPGARIPPMPASEHIEHMAIRIARAKGE